MYSPRHGKKLLYIIIFLIFTKTASFRSYCVICLPQMPQLLLSHKIRIPTESMQHGHELLFAILTKNGFVQKLERICLSFSCAYLQYKYTYIYI